MPLSSTIVKIILVINKVPIHISLTMNTFSESGLEVVAVLSDQEEMANVRNITLFRYQATYS